MRILLALVLGAAAACTGSPNYQRAYAPTMGHAPADLTTRAIDAVTDAGFTVETSTDGVIVSKWEPGRGFGGGGYRYRVRVSAREGGDFVVAMLCQQRVAVNSEWITCDEVRPQGLLDAQAKITAEIEAAQ